MAIPIHLGTCAFTASGWSGAFYPKRMKSAEYLAYYSRRFATVEVDSTFYGCPQPKTVENWYHKTQPEFIFSVKAPQSITHEKILVDCQAELETFVETMALLREKLGVILFQFPHLDKWQVKDRHAFADRLLPFLKLLPQDRSFAIEIRNRTWLDAEFADLLRSFNVALVLQDIHAMPAAAELSFDPITANFSYVRLLGNRKQIELTTTVWDQVVEDKTDKVSDWVKYCLQVQKRGITQYVYANNHYEGYSPATIEKFRDLWKKAGGGEIGKLVQEQAAEEKAREKGLFD